ncbi:unnamed protein product [Bursaphelenchus okinawaensis]|uniref:NADP-dependent oxidoreductase domain-containing protein n=1 Tax=Bursaphelenchus okinawaensis TaxID=465554 RepID=A0A811L126_9BILA|nr:unnamed protein product [Bursaphelenchus okinawaensis]CAG9114824.1 unnamed protein product [Bursaphelenchus okinawaensis]
MSQAGGPRVKLNTGYEIPLVGFGTYKVTGNEGLDVAVDAALKAGYRHFDTAKFYVNEPELGASLEKLLPKHGLKREDVFITTKLWPAKENNTEVTVNLVNESLANFKTDYVDLVLIHYPKSNDKENEDPTNKQDRKDLWLALEKLHKAGQIRSIGVSNYEVRHLKEIPEYSSTVPAVNQLEYHPHFRRQDIKDYCKEHGIFFQAFSSLARYEPALINDPLVNELAKKYNTSIEQVLLSFATSQNVGIVPKSTNPGRIEANFQVVNFKLSDEDVEKLNNINVDKHYIRCTGWLVQ